MSALGRILDRDRWQAAVERRGRLLVWLGLLVGALAWLDLLIRVIGPALASLHFPTSAYWVAPRLVWEGRGAVLFDPSAFTAAAVELGALPDLGFVPNAPAGVLPLLPFGLLPEAVAYQLWTLLSVGCLIAAVALLALALRLSLTATVLLFAVVPLFHPLRSNIAVGQAYAFVLLAAGAVAMASARRPPSSLQAGLAFAVVAILKLYYGLALLAATVLGRRWKALAAWAALMAVAVAVSAALVGPDAWLVWLQTALGWRLRPETSVTAYQTLNSLFGHLFRYDFEWNPFSVADLPVVADALWFVVALVIATVSAWVIARSSRDDDSGRSPVGLHALAIVVPVALVLSPVAEDHHYLLALLPLLVAGVALFRERSIEPIQAIALLAAVVLLAPAWPFSQPLAAGWSAVLFYPRVYGALLLWGVLVVQAWRLRPRPT